jgi:hypothetical protein
LTDVVGIHADDVERFCHAASVAAKYDNSRIS